MKKFPQRPVEIFQMNATPARRKMDQTAYRMDYEDASHDGSVVCCVGMLECGIVVFGLLRN